MGFVLVLVSILSIPVNAQENKVNVIVDGSGVDMETILENDRTFVPLDILGEKLDFEIGYNDNQISILKDNIKISLDINSNKVMVNNEELELDVKPLLKNEDIFVPLRFVAERIGKDVTWDGSNYNVLIGEFNQEANIEDTFIYYNEEYAYTLNLPISWKDEAIIETKDGTLYVYDKKTSERFIEDGSESYGPVFEVRLSDYSLTAGLTYSYNYVLYYSDGKYIEALFDSDFQFYPETLDSYKKIYDEGLKVLGSFSKLDADPKQVKTYDDGIGRFWDNLVDIPESHTELDIYWSYIDDEIMEDVDDLVEKNGVEVLFKGLESTNEYSQYYCINRLVEYYNDDHIRINSIEKITPFLDSNNGKLKDGGEFAISVLTKKFDSPYIADIDEDTKVFALFNNYSDYGSYNELWIIKNDKLSKLHSFSDLQAYIDGTEKIQISPSKDKIAVQTCSRRSSSINIIDLNNGDVSPELMKLAIEKVALDNKDYNNTYPDGAYSWASNLKWVDNNTLVFEAALSYNFMEIIENVNIKYNLLDNSLEYIKQSTETGDENSNNGIRKGYGK